MTPRLAPNAPAGQTLTALTAPHPPAAPDEPDRADVEHPPWCDLAACTARPDPDPRDLRRFGQHVSRPVALGALSWLFVGVTTATAHLTRTHAPWRCDTYLWFTDGDPRASLSIPARDARTILAALADLLATDDPTDAHDDDPRRAR